MLYKIKIHGWNVLTCTFMSSLSVRAVLLGFQLKSVRIFPLRQCACGFDIAQANFEI
jgi:hypothetical protein